MGSGASVGNIDRENCEQFGDRVEVTKSLPVESFGEDKTSTKDGRLDNVVEKTFSSVSVSEEKFRDRGTAKVSKSRKSLGSLLGFTKGRWDDVERTNSDLFAYSAEAAEIKIARLTKKNNDLQQEKERLKRELESLRKSNARWQNEREKAREDEEQARERAKVFEDELEKVKKQFKSYSSDKEKEIHTLMRRIHELENSLRSSTAGETSSLYPLPESLIDSFENDADVDNLSLFKAPGSLFDEKIPDFNTVFPLLAQVMTTLKPPNKNQTFRFFLSADKQAKRDATFFTKVIFPQLQKLCKENGKFLVMVESDGHGRKSEMRDKGWQSYLIAKCDLFFGVLGSSVNRSLLDKWRSFHNIFNTRRRPIFFCFKEAKHNASDGTEVTHFLDSIGEKSKVSFYTHATNLVEENNEVIHEIVKEHFGLSADQNAEEHSSSDISDEELISDGESSLRQLDILRMFTMSTESDVGFERYFEKLDEYVNSVGQCPPLLVTGASGSGKTTLLAKWITRQIASGENVILYNFVASTTNNVFTNPAHVMRRFTSQFLGLFPCLCAMLHCDPVKCEEYFLKLLKTVPAKINTNIVIVIDSVDKLQNFSSTHYLNWLNEVELLPATVRVILSVTTGNEPSHLRSWNLEISPLTFDESRDVLVSCWRHSDITLRNNEASKLLKNLSHTAIASPLFLTMLSRELSRTSDVVTDIQEYALFKNVVELTVSTLKSLQESKGPLINEILSLVACSRSGLTEAELMEILSLQWSEWEPLLKCLVYDRPILCDVNDFLVVSHEQILKGIFIHLNGEETMRQSRERLVEFYTDKLKNDGVSASVIDQLPWLLVQRNDKESLEKFISRIDVFLVFIKRSLFSDLLSYWQNLNYECSAFAKIYMDKIRKQEGDTPCLEIALRYEILGRFLKGIGLFSLAMKCLERALEMKEMVLESDDPWVGQSLHHLADLYVMLGNLESAEASYKQTLEINENTLGKDHPLIAKELECLAHVKKKQKKERACTELERKAARIRRKASVPKMSMLSFSNNLDCRLIQVNNLGAGRKTPETATSLHNVGVLLSMEKRYQDAETLFKKSLAMREFLFGEKDLVLTQSLDKLASLYYDKKMYFDAITYHKRSLVIKREKLEEGDPSLISTLNQLAIAFRKNGNFEASESTYREVLVELKRKHDGKDQAIATALHNLAVVNSDQKKLCEALQLFEQALKIYEDCLGENHPKVADSLRNIAKVHLDMGNSDDASSYLLRSQTINQIDTDLSMTTSSLNSSMSWINGSTLEVMDC
ncbi:nephrocystin-3-like [Dendronephthya gigantea]|uniref:nephrocystin-3-like n=1 Tax=Dendronephthya gigantea TaxID=151771 RepID=UPI001069F02F|nr:nephrocystin-3-like [Dendronephthya gigantea]